MAAREHKKSPRRHKTKKNSLTANEMADIPAFDYQGDGEGMTGTTDNALFHMNKPHYSSVAERFMRSHLFEVLVPDRPSQLELKTSTAIKKVQHVERLALVEADRIQREEDKIKNHERIKAEKMSRFQASMLQHYKVDTRMEKEKRTRVLEASAIPWKPLAIDNQEESGPDSNENRSALDLEEPAELEAESFRSLWDEVEEEEDDGFGPREMQYDNVYTDVAVPTVRDPDKPPALKYNVQLQVGPKDLTKVFSTAPWRKGKVRMYDVGLSVGPKDWDIIRPKSVWEKAPGHDDDHVQPGEPAKTEEELMESARFEWDDGSKRADAAVMVHPLGYKELKLSTSMDAICVDLSIQVDERDIERQQAAQRGITLRDDNILWPTNREFTPELFELKMENYIDQCWKLDPEWKYFIKHIQQHTTNYRNKYIFEVIFSIPTVTHPVPIATASIFFIVDIEHYAHLDEQIKVHYCVEGMRYAHSPGHLPFQSKWLTSSVADKIRIQKQWAMEPDQC